MSTAPLTAGKTDAAMIRRVRRAGAIGNFIEYFDNALYAYFAVTIAALFFPKVDPVAGLLSTFAVFGVAFFIRPLGGVVFGHIGDRWGRKLQLILALLLMSVSTTAIGLLPTYDSVGLLAPVLLMACRLLQGFSVGGESTGAFVLVVEHSPVATRGRNTAPLIVFTIAGAACAALLAMFITTSLSPDQLLAWGWRLPFFAAVPLGLVGLWLRMSIDDSDAFKEAAKTSGAASKRAAGKHEAPLLRAIRTVPKEMFILFSWVAMQAVAGYLIIGYMVSHLVQFEGYTMTTALLILVGALTIVMFTVTGMGRLADKISRKKFAMVISVALLVWTFPAFFLLELGPVAAVIALAIHATFMYSSMLAAGMAIVELFPVDVRSSASGLAYSAAFSVFGGTIPFIATWFAANFGPVAPAYYVVAFAAIGVFVAWLGLPNAREMAVTTEQVQSLRQDAGPERETIRAFD
ncbi:MFS transporter [Arthrobacter crystallopoietes]|uniref:MFS transporter n=1 Tax=Crystallibacter crystallopoietes TaxID=37928 RepID=UPI003D243BBA